MSNRRRLRFGRGFNAEEKQQQAMSARGNLFSGADLPDGEKALLAKLEMPASESEVIKVVPAKVDGVEVGTAYIHEDGQVSIMFHDDAPDEQLEKIKATSLSVGYDLETGERSGPPGQE